MSRAWQGEEGRALVIMTDFAPVLLLIMLAVSVWDRIRLRRSLLALTAAHSALLDAHAGCPARGGPGGDDDELAASTPAEHCARMMAALRDATGPITEAANGERLQREADGWSPWAAEHMGLMLYSAGMSRLRAMISGGDDD